MALKGANSAASVLGSPAIQSRLQENVTTFSPGRSNRLTLAIPFKERYGPRVCHPFNGPGYSSQHLSFVGYTRTSRFGAW